MELENMILSEVSQAHKDKDHRKIKEKGTLIYCWWECISTMESSMEVPQKTKNRTKLMNGFLKCYIQ
jgi:hypothetical protein